MCLARGPQVLRCPRNGQRKPRPDACAPSLFSWCAAATAPGPPRATREGRGLARCAHAVFARLHRAVRKPGYRPAWFSEPVHDFFAARANSWTEPDGGIGRPCPSWPWRRQAPGTWPAHTPFPARAKIVNGSHNGGCGRAAGRTSPRARPAFGLGRRRAAAWPRCFGMPSAPLVLLTGVAHAFRGGRSPCPPPSRPAACWAPAPGC